VTSKPWGYTGEGVSPRSGVQVNPSRFIIKILFGLIQVQFQLIRLIGLGRNLKLEVRGKSESQDGLAMGKMELKMPLPSFAWMILLHKDKKWHK